MKTNFKKIHIGELIKLRVEELDLEMNRICAFLSLTEPEISLMYQHESINSEYLLRWCKLLEYDYFRIYSQHLILYAPQASCISPVYKPTKMPVFRKNLYTKEIIDFMIELIANGMKSRADIIKEYKIPKTTLYKWLHKYQQADT